MPSIFAKTLLLYLQEVGNFIALNEVERIKKLVKYITWW
ncbi:Hypothetical protein EfmE4452_0643 [Enterococcus faecium E4452]|nr:Hypothetical protein EfmE4452_0643 [Enterococcus faecium E4452]